MAFNGSDALQAGRAGRLLRVGRRRVSGRTSTRPRASTKRSTCSTCRPIARASLDHGLAALGDFAGGLTLEPTEVDKERGVVLEEWRQRLGVARACTKLPIAALTDRNTRIGCRSACRTSFSTLPISAPARVLHTSYRRIGLAVIAVGDIDCRSGRAAIVADASAASSRVRRRRRCRTRRPLAQGAA